MKVTIQGFDGRRPRVALDGNASASLVMAQIIGLTDIGHGIRAISTSSAKPGSYCSRRSKSAGTMVMTHEAPAFSLVGSSGR